MRGLMECLMFQSLSEFRQCGGISGVSFSSLFWKSTWEGIFPPSHRETNWSFIAFKPGVLVLSYNYHFQPLRPLCQPHNSHSWVWLPFSFLGCSTARGATPSVASSPILVPFLHFLFYLSRQLFMTPFWKFTTSPLATIITLMGSGANQSESSLWYFYL